MPDDVLGLIDDIAGLRLQIKEEIQKSKARIAVAQPVALNRRKRLSMLRLGQVKLVYLTANLQEAAEVNQELTAWWRARNIREQAYGADMKAAGAAEPDVKTPLLLKIRADCQHEFAVEITQLHVLAANMETLRRQYDEVLEK